MRLALLFTLAALALGGCNSTAPTEQSTVRDDGVDRDHMGRVEQAASRAGARVHWVNPPVKQQK
jgi:hypothetical protein